MVMTAAHWTVSTILRLHDPSQIDRLELALFSLCGQRHAYIEPIIMLQRFSEGDAAAVKSMAQRLPWHEDSRPPIVINMQRIDEGDQRSVLLNRGLDAATGEAVGFLDYDDYLYPNAYSLLVERLVKGADAAMGGVMIAYITPDSTDGIVDSKVNFAVPAEPLSFFSENIFPIHSLLIRRSAIGAARAAEHLKALEDYHLLLQVLKDAKWDTSLMNYPICEYVYWRDGRNTVEAMGSSRGKKTSWDQAREFIRQWKSENSARRPMSDLVRLLQRSSAADAGLGGTSHSGLVALATLAKAFRLFFPLVSRGRHLSSKIEVDRSGPFISKIRGTIHKAEPTALCVLCFRARAGWRFVSPRLIAVVVPSFKDGSLVFEVGVQDLYRNKMRKGDIIVAYALCGNGKIYRLGDLVN